MTVRDPADVASATLPEPGLYGDPLVFAQLQGRVFARSWQLLALREELPAPGQVRAVTLGPGSLDEPLLLVNDGGRLRALSNVCTHRGALLVDPRAEARRGEGAGAACRAATGLRCPYHGRRFGLDGRLVHAPEFEGARGFPRTRDHLPEVALGVWGPFVFASLAPAVPFEVLTAPLSRVAHLDWDAARLDVEGEQVYELDASWALWVENYLEGFHVPWVHPGLARELDWRRYRTQLDPWGVTQVGFAPEGGAGLDVPEGHPDAGGPPVAAWYHWLFATTALNVYPWGVSLNLVEPAGPTRTRIRYRRLVWDAAKLGSGAGGGLDRVELEDDAIVESVQRGVRSRLYRPGRYAPAWEGGLRLFHLRLDELMAG